MKSLELYFFTPALCVPTGRILLVHSGAGLYDDVAINVRWLLPSTGGNFRCKLSTGDGRVFFLKSPEA